MDEVRNPFKPGDRVRVNASDPNLQGMTGRVLEVDGEWTITDVGGLTVPWKDGRKRGWAFSDFRRLDLVAEDPPSTTARGSSRWFDSLRPEEKAAFAAAAACTDRGVRNGIDPLLSAIKWLSEIALARESQACELESLLTSQRAAERSAAGRAEELGAEIKRWRRWAEKELGLTEVNATCSSVMRARIGTKLSDSSRSVARVRLLERRQTEASLTLQGYRDTKVVR